MLRKRLGLRVSQLATATARTTYAYAWDAIPSQQNQFQNISFLRRYEQNASAKLAIAQRAAALVDDGDSILLDASTTA